MFPALLEGCIPLTPAWTRSFVVTLHLDRPRAQDATAAAATHTARVRRFGFNLSDAYAVTDYYCQGMNFKHAKWMAHLSIPPDRGGLRRPAVFVVMTRWGEWKLVWLSAPLWPAGDMRARADVIAAFHRLACLEPELLTELHRLRAAADTCKTMFADQWRRAEEAVAGN
jgi:hypothetical protein